MECYLSRNYKETNSAGNKAKTDMEAIMQYPLKKYYELVCDMAHVRGARVVTLIHDLGSFRRKALSVEREIRRLNHSDVVIAHNESMLRGCGITGAVPVFSHWAYSTICRPRTFHLSLCPKAPTRWSTQVD